MSSYPPLADTVIVQHAWWDDATRAGVNATVTWTPLPYSGATSPNLTDAQDRAWVKTRSWTSRPDSTSGYMAVPLTASNDPDLTGFLGYRVEPQGETAFTIPVDVNIPYTSATQEMVTALAALTPPVPLTVGAQVRAVWLTDIAPISPSPTPPASYLTATQARNFTLDAVAAHDTDPDAHPDIRALIGSSGGGGGGGTPSGGAGGVLSGTYPNPGFAVDMATQAELDTVANRARSYRHSQVSAAATWTVAHNLGFNPAGVIARDSVGLIEPADVSYPNTNTCVLTWAVPVSGSVYLS